MSALQSITSSLVHFDTLRHMDTTRKIIIYVTFIVVTFIAFALRVWVLGGRRDSFRKELIASSIVLVVFAAIAAVIIFINN